MNVLSLFDGISAGQEAINRSKIEIDKYYSSEIDKYAQDVTRYNHKDSIFLGDVRKIDIKLLSKIDLLIGGSPCQSFSFAGKMKGAITKDNIEIVSLEQYLELKERKFEFDGQSYLFWEYVRILEEIKEKNPNIIFLLENVIMIKKWEEIITRTLGVEPIEINSSLVSAQNRRRLYWTNIKGIEQPKEKYIYLKDIIDLEESKFINKQFNMKNDIEYSKNLIKNSTFFENTIVKTKKSFLIKDNSIEEFMILGAAERGRNIGGVNIKFLEIRKDDKSNCITTVASTHYIVYINIKNEYKVRMLNPLECERVQTFKDDYTKFGKDTADKIYLISNSQRYKMLGNSWTVDVIKHIFDAIDIDC